MSTCWHIPSKLYTILGFPLIFVVNPVSPCKPYITPPSLRGWGINFSKYDCVGERGEKFLLDKWGGGEGESGGVEGMGVTFEMGEIEEIQYCL